MRPILALLILLALSGSAQSTTEVLSDEGDQPRGAVILVVDGMGSAYVYPELMPRALDGTPLKRALLFNLTGKGARVLNLTVPVPETGPSHSVLVTGCSWADSSILGTPGATIFDAARAEGLLCLAILQRGDSMSMVLEQDCVLFFDDNSLWGAEPLVGSKADLPSDLADLFQSWRDEFPEYNRERGVPGYVGYNAWGLDAAADVVGAMGTRPFLLMVNVGAVDSAGHNLGAARYVEIISGLDAPLGRLLEACEAAGVLLLITADHGMSFPSDRDKGGHSSAKYSSLAESVMVPAVFFGPGVDEIAVTGNWSEVDLAPTLLDLLGLLGKRPDLPLSEGRVIPVSKRCDLIVDAGKVADVEVRRDGSLVARASGDSRYIFRSLERGSYTVVSAGRKASVYLDGDRAVDLPDESPRGFGAVLSPIFDRENRKLIAVGAIIAMNVVGAVMIFRIMRR